MTCDYNIFIDIGITTQKTVSRNHTYKWHI